MFHLVKLFYYRIIITSNQKENCVESTVMALAESHLDRKRAFLIPRLLT